MLDQPHQTRTGVPNGLALDELRTRLARAEEGERRWRSIIESPFDFIMVLDHDLVIRYINRVSFGFRREDVVGHTTILDYIAPEHHNEVCSKIRSVFATGQPEYYESFAQAPVERWFLTLVSPFERSDRIDSVSLQSRDITAQKVAERDLEEIENRFVQLADNIHDCFYLLDIVENRALYVSPAVEKVLGIPGGDFHQDPQAWLRAVHPDDRPRCEMALRRLMMQENEFGVPFEYRVVRDGEVRWVQHRAFPVRNHRQKPVRVAGIVTDITERKAAAQSLLEAEARYRKLLETLPVISYVAQPGTDHATRYVSPQIEWTLGYTQEEWTSNPSLWWDRIHPEDKDEARRAVREFQRSGEPLRMQYRLLAKDGVPITVREEATLVQLDGSGESRVHGVLLDVSETMDARAAQQRAREASAQLVKVQEDERRHLARELHDEVGQSLTLLRILLEAIEGGGGDERSTKLLQAKQHVQELMTRIRRMALDLRPTVLDDLGLLPALDLLMGRVREECGLEVRFEHSGLGGARLPSPIETGVYRSVQEALTNCMRHAEAQLVLVRVWQTPSALNVQVEDNGGGFDVDEVWKNPEHAGLVGIRERVLAMGGEFDVESAPGEGCRLLIQVPLER